MERSRRAFSSEPFHRSADLSQHGQDADALNEEQEAAEQDKNALSRLLDAKLAGTTKFTGDGEE